MTVIQRRVQRYEGPRSVVLIDSLRSVTITALEHCWPRINESSASVVSTFYGTYLRPTAICVHMYIYVYSRLTQDNIFPEQRPTATESLVL